MRLHQVYIPPNLQADFSIVVLPDTQHYMFYGDDAFDSQISWIIDKRDSLNIAFVVHESDMIGNNSADNTQWITFTSIMDKLWSRMGGGGERLVPYGVVLGNHDYSLDGTRNSEMFNDYMPLSVFQSMPTFGGAFEANRSDNTYHTFDAGRKSWLVLMLEFDPRDEVLDWANTVVSEHPKHIIMGTTHGYLNETDAILLPGENHSPINGYNLGTNANSAVDIWDKLISQHENIRFVFCGHTGTNTNGAAYLVGNGANNKPVYQMMANFQSFNYHKNYLRILKFNISQNAVEVVTYSPEQGNFIENNAEAQYQVLIENAVF